MPYYTQQYLPPPGTQVQSLPLRDEFTRIVASFNTAEADINLRARTDLSNTFLLTQSLNGGFVAQGTIDMSGANVVLVPTQAQGNNSLRAASTAYVDSAALLATVPAGAAAAAQLFAAMTLR